jgi:preprotein translocase subunit Sec63
MRAMLQQELRKWMADFAKGIGMDPDQLSSAGRQPGLDPYRVLGLDRSASDDEVKSRYRRLLHRLHPDTAGVAGSEFLLGMVVEAYRRISEERGWS